MRFIVASNFFLDLGKGQRTTPVEATSPAIKDEFPPGEETSTSVEAKSPPRDEGNAYAGALPMEEKEGLLVEKKELSTGEDEGQLAE